MLLCISVISNVCLSDHSILLTTLSYDDHQDTPIEILRTKTDWRKFTKALDSLDIGKYLSLEDPDTLIEELLRDRLPIHIET